MPSEALADLAAPARPWVPKRVLATRAALSWPEGEAMAERAAALGAEVVRLPGDRLTNLPEAYRDAKTTMALVVAPPSKRRPQPIPPSADWRFDLATGCPAHCGYCYLAGSLAGPPIIRAHANLPEILAELPPLLGRGQVTSRNAARAAEGTTFECSCYTDPLGLEPITGALAATIRFFGAWDAAVQLRFTTKYDGVAPLLGLPHGRRTRIRFSVNARGAERFEGGAPRMTRRLAAMRQAALAGYRIGLTVAPIMPVPDWEAEYGRLLADCAAALAGAPDPDLTVELITHRFTEGSREVLRGWYPGSGLEMEEAQRSRKTTKFGGVKWVFPRERMAELRTALEASLARHLPGARRLYWT
ncbi:SPL family radical SAM protein [Roseicella aquatilis]|uniref:Radical SAM protein n=1 Tax=Roseicella aquatilis TaxID=2527868 RepID=A0A4R4DCR2_9PROT|nr:radical SAM protein [Roseicella aquatilis]TCZ57202.1 radical SAM protein [Roseicella aquatilis]